MNTHAGIVNRLLWMQSEYGLTVEDRILQKTSCSFDVSVWEFFWGFIAGAALCLITKDEHRDPRALLNVIRSKNITTVHFVPSMLQVFLGEMRRKCALPLKRVICSGEALTADVISNYFSYVDASLNNLYGPTEAAIDVTFIECGAGSTSGCPIGRPIWNTQVYVLDEGLEPVPVGVVGELYICLLYTSRCV